MHTLLPQATAKAKKLTQELEQRLADTTAALQESQTQCSAEKARVTRLEEDLASAEGEVAAMVRAKKGTVAAESEAEARVKELQQELRQVKRERETVDAEASRSRAASVEVGACDVVWLHGVS